MKTPIYLFQDLTVSENCILNFEKIKFSDTPYKKVIEQGIVYFIDMYYKNNSIIIQIPRYPIKCISKNKLTIKVDNDFIDYLIKPLEEHIINSVHKYSERWFDGKKFTLNKIINSMISPKKVFEIDITLHKDTLYFNRYRNIITFDDIESDVDEKQIMCLIKISSLQFIKNRFTYQIQLEQGKVFMNEKLVEYSFIENENSLIESDPEYYRESINSDRDFFV